MKFLATPDALALKKARGEPIQAVANWTVRRGRYRTPTEPERLAAGIGAKHGLDSTVCRDEGLLFLRDGETIYAYTIQELRL